MNVDMNASIGDKQHINVLVGGEWMCNMRL
jgi:hypothetical protein